MRAAALTPGALYAQSEDGLLWKSTDGGRSWKLTGTTPYRESVQLIVDPKNADTLYVLDGNHVLWKSTGGGASWSLIGTELQDFAISPSSPQTLFAVDLPPGKNPVLIRSDDGGASWRFLPQGPLGGLTVDPTTPEVVYATGNGHLYKSLDGGASWSMTSAGDSGFDGISLVAIDPHDRQVLYGSTADVNLLASSDGGATWALANHGIEGLFLERFVIAPSGDLYGVSLAVVYTSTDRGAHWMRVGFLGFPPYVRGFAVDAGSPDRLYASLFATDGMLLSTDGGHTWTPSDTVPTALAPQQLAVSRNQPGKIYAEVTSSGSDLIGGLRRSDDGGATWSLLAPTGSYSPLRITLDARAGVVYTVREEARAYLLRSDDDGASWITQPSPQDFVIALAAEPRVSRALWQLGFPTLNSRFPDLQHSIDGGATWSIMAEIDDPLDGPHINQGAIFIAPAAPEAIYLLLPTGRLYATTDGGATVESVQPPAPVVDLAVDPTRAGRGRLYAAITRRQPVWRSLDRGATWQQASRGLPPRTMVVALAIDPITPTTVYAATDRGVWVTDDGAKSWQPLGTGLPDLPLLSLAVVPGTPRTVLVGTRGAGAYSLTR